ncbi:conserved hypothetical protein [Bathymodiolus platifrons methanotrophic gill symbiont]|nr:hypothetical protein [Bathymodiolus platifrons methanotrophic gill symbiont]GAW87340.1 conserved hypothetical protein [Bathymodiolus platifrons methanotrophic gill symbiont]
MQTIKEQDWKTLPESAQKEAYDFFLFIKQRYAIQTGKEKAETIAFSNHNAITIDEWLDDKEDDLWKQILQCCFM